ncbi:hypothetical protein OB13_01870 [Pontibacter sp. HJ8]
MHIPELPTPILFHPLKHHLLYIREFIRLHTFAEEADLKAAIRTIGSSQLDFYTGDLTAQQIAQEVIAYLGEKELLTAEAYRLYLAATKSDYSTVRLSDNSEWILRWGIVAGRYAHLHPGRYARHTLRVKANTLKTAVATRIAAKRSAGSETDLQLINQVRALWLELPPVQIHEANGGIASLLTLLGD